VVRIVDPNSHEPLETGIGEVWVAGETVAQGYWRAPQASRKTFDARLRGETTSFLRTGDLGFFHEGELYLCGRLKDVIVVRGANFHPQDIEIAAEQAQRTVRAGHSTVFAIERGGEECIVVLAEIHRSCSEAAEHASVMQAIRKAISQSFDLSVAEIRLLRSDCLPRTSSGKKQRTR
jgi:acyl-CoA synthetase (AMP-forming)/AMP-acid ligase II